MIKLKPYLPQIAQSKPALSFSDTQNKSSKALLQQQVISGANDEEKTIALHTLLLRDLMLGDYQGYEQDKQLSPHIQQSVDQKKLCRCRPGGVRLAGR